MIKDQEYLSEKASYCLDLAKRFGATESSIVVGNSISETVNFRNQKLDESNRSDNLAINLTTYVGKKKSSISSSNLLKENLDTLIEKCIETTKNTPEDEFNSLPDKNLLAKEVKDLNLYDDTHIENDNKVEYLTRFFGGRELKVWQDFLRKKHEKKEKSGKLDKISEEKK